MLKKSWGTTGLESGTPEMRPLAQKKISALVSLFPMNRCSKLVRLTLTEEEVEQLKEKTRATAEHIVAAWLGILYYAQYEAGNKLVRLDSSLSPPPELATYEEFSWEECLEGTIALTAEQIRALMVLYAKTLVPVFNLMIANNPNGFNLAGDVIICMDTDGFYLPPKDKK